MKNNLAILVGAILISLAIFNIKPQETTNISEYLKLQDDKIATQSAIINRYKDRVEQLEEDEFESWQTIRLLEERLSEEEQEAFWDEWSETLCLEFHEKWYCEGED